MPKSGLPIGEFCYSNDCVRTSQQTNFPIVFQAFIIISFFFVQGSNYVLWFQLVRILSEYSMWFLDQSLVSFIEGECRWDLNSQSLSERNERVFAQSCFSPL